MPRREDIIFEPFDPGYIHDLIPCIPKNIDPSDPLALFDLFIPSDMYETIATNTNKYATLKGASTERVDSHHRAWYSTSADEIRVFFGILLYIGVVQCPRFKWYQESSGIDRPKHLVSTFMTLDRYVNLRRYLYILDLDKGPPSQ